MIVTRRTMLGSAALWVAALFATLAAVAWLWSGPLVAKLLFSLAVLALVVVQLALFAEYLEWLEVELENQAWGPPIPPVPTFVPPTVKKYRPHRKTEVVEAVPSRERKMNAVGGKSEGFGASRAGLGRPALVDASDAFEDWKRRQAAGDGDLASLILEVQGNDPECAVCGHPRSDHPACGPCHECNDLNECRAFEYFDDDLPGGVNGDPGPAGPKFSDEPKVSGNPAETPRTPPTSTSKAVEKYPLLPRPDSEGLR